MITNLGVIPNSLVYTIIGICILYVDIMLVFFRTNPLTLNSLMKYELKELDFGLFLFINLCTAFVGGIISLIIGFMYLDTVFRNIIMGGILAIIIKIILYKIMKRK